MFEDEERVKKPVAHEVGCDLSTLSVDELSERVDLLENEIVRLKKAIDSKGASREAADAFFKS